MIDVDTNVLVRYITKDDDEQAQEATVFLASNQCRVLQTVLLETVWVLGSKSGYNWERDHIIERIRKVIGLPNISIQQPRTASQALVWYELGMDFADALHLANSSGQFATFDRRLSDKAEKLQTHNTVIFLGKDEIK